MLEEFFRLFKMPPDERVVELLNTLKQLPVYVGNSLTKLLQTNFNVNILFIKPSFLKRFENTLAHIIVFDNYFKPLPNIKIKVEFEDPEVFSVDYISDEYGSVIVVIPKGTFQTQGGYLKIYAFHQDYTEYFRAYSYGGASSWEEKQEILISILTDLEQYRPGQPIYVRGLIWEKKGLVTKPISKSVLYISLVSPENQEISKQKIDSDDFGVFDAQFPLDEIIKEGDYRLRFDFQDFEKKIEKRIQIKRFKTPQIKLEITHPDSVFCGDEILVEVEARYFYGDPVHEGTYKINLINAAGISVEEQELSCTAEGNLKTAFSSKDLPLGVYGLSVKMHDAVGREIEKNVVILLKSKELEEYKKESNIITWDFSLNQIPSDEKINFILKFQHQSAEEIFNERPVFIYLKDREDRIFHIHEGYETADHAIEFQISFDVKGLFYMEVLRFTNDGVMQRMRHSLMLTPSDREILLEIQGPERAQPGEEISFEINVLSDHKQKPLELGCLLVDAAVRSISGGPIPRPFQNTPQLEEFIQTLEYENSWNQKVSEFYRLLDDFLSSLFRNHEGKISLYHFFSLIRFLEKSAFNFEEFINYHRENLYFSFLIASDEDILDFFENIMRYDQISHVHMERLTRFLKYRENAFDLMQKLFFYVLKNISEKQTQEFNKIKAKILDNFIRYHVKKLDSSQSFEKVLDTLKEWVSFIESHDIHSELTLGLLEEWKQYLQKRSEVFKGSELFKHEIETFYEPVVITMNSDLVSAGFVGEDQPRTVFPTLIGYPKYTSIMTDVEHNGVSDQKEVKSPVPEAMEQKVTIRTFFADTGYWNPRLMVTGGSEHVQLKLPDSITQQDFVVQASSMDCDIGAATKSVLVQQEFFIQADLPVDFYYGDKLTLGAILTNRTEEILSVNVSLKVEGLDLTDNPNQAINLPPNTAERVEWEVKANHVGEAKLEFTATCPRYKDVEKRSVYVHPNGDPIKKITTGVLNPAINTWTLEFSPDEIAHQAFFTIVPDQLHGALDGLEAMMKYPYGCVEQTMSCVLPNLLVYDYLSKRGKLSIRLNALIKEYTLKGLQRILHFRHKDFGWGWWENDLTSIFMTAYVLKGFAKMVKLGFHVPQDIIDRTIEMILTHQKEDGSWEPEPGLRWDRMSRSSGLGHCVMTLFIIQSLLDAGVVVSDIKIQDALKYILLNLNHIQEDPNGLSRAYILFQSIDPRDSLCTELIEKLLSIRGSTLWSDGSAMGGFIESSSLAIQALYREDAKKYEFLINDVVGEIIKLRSPLGGWKTTSDTAAVVETFLELQEGESPLSKISLKLNELTKELSVDPENIDIAFINMRNIPLYRALHLGSNELTVDLYQGKKLYYQLSELIWKKKWAEEKASFSITRTHSRQECKIGDQVQVKISVEALSDTTQFAVLEERIPSGFVLDDDLLQKSLLSHPNLDHYELALNKIILFPKDAITFEFEYTMIALRPFMGIHPSTLIHAMYDPGIRALNVPVDIIIHTQMVNEYKELIEELGIKAQISLEEFQNRLGISKERSIMLIETLKTHFPNLIKGNSLVRGDYDLQLLLKESIELVAEWQRIGGR